MTTPGYPDYQRLSLQSGILLYGANAAITSTVVAFQGYVGNLQYINSFWNAVGGSDSYSIQLLFATDSTFTTFVSQIVAYRNGNSEGFRQFGIFTPWLKLQLVPKAGTSATVVQASFYGCMGEISAAKLGGFTKSIYDQEGSIGAGTTVTTTLTVVSPGTSVLSVFTNAAVWDLQLLAYDFPTNAFSIFFHMNSGGQQTQGQSIVAMPDSITQVKILNGDAAAKNFGVHLMPLIEG